MYCVFNVLLVVLELTVLSIGLSIAKSHQCGTVTVPILNILLGETQGNQRSHEAWAGSKPLSKSRKVIHHYPPFFKNRLTYVRIIFSYKAFRTQMS